MINFAPNLRDCKIGQVLNYLFHPTIPTDRDPREMIGETIAIDHTCDVLEGSLLQKRVIPQFIHQCDRVQDVFKVAEVSDESGTYIVWERIR